MMNEKGSESPKFEPALKNKRFEIGQKVKLSEIPFLSYAKFRIEGREGLYQIHREGKEPMINKVFRAEEGPRKGKWSVILKDTETADGDMEVEIAEYDEE